MDGCSKGRRLLRTLVLWRGGVWPRLSLQVFFGGFEDFYIEYGVVYLYLYISRIV